MRYGTWLHPLALFAFVNEDMKVVEVAARTDPVHPRSGSGLSPSAGPAQHSEQIVGTPAVVTPPLFLSTVLPNLHVPRINREKFTNRIPTQENAVFTLNHLVMITG